MIQVSDVETNGNIKINEDITMNSNFDRVWCASITHLQ